MYRPALGDPGACGCGANVCTPGYAGNRIRVIKKNALYTAAPGGPEPLEVGNQFAADFAGRAGGQYYDLYSNTGDEPTAGTPLVNMPPIPYTAVFNNEMRTRPQVNGRTTRMFRTG